MTFSFDYMHMLLIRKRSSSQNNESEPCTLRTFAVYRGFDCIHFQSARTFLLSWRTFSDGHISVDYIRVITTQYI